MIPAAIALGAGSAGAIAFSLAGFPAGALVGSTAAVAAIAFAGLKPAVPGPLRNAGFVVIGVTLGAGITPDFLENVAHWPASLAALTVTMAVIMTLSGLILRRGFGLGAGTAVLATSPGNLSYSLALAMGGAGEVRAVMVLQTLRLMLLTVALPPLIAAIDGGAGQNFIAMSGTVLAARPDMAPLPSIALIAAAFAAGMAMERLRTPAAFLLAGLAVSGAAHAADIVHGRPALAITFAGFTIAGCLIGSRFGGISRAELRRLGLAGVVVTAVASAISAAASAGVAAWLGVPFGQVWVAFAPGGVEGMAAMAIALGYEPAFVATHHIFRIVVLIALLPLLVRLFGERP